MGSTVVNLKDCLNKTFTMERYGIVKEVILDEVLNRKVYLKYPGRTDRFSLSIEKFTKYYQIKVS